MAAATGFSVRTAVKSTTAETCRRDSYFFAISVPFAMNDYIIRPITALQHNYSVVLSNSPA